MKSSVVLALAVLAFSAGCQTANVNSVERASPVGQPNYVADKRVITDASLAGSIGIIAVNQGTVSGDHLRIQVRVENRRNKAVGFRYRIEWFDGQGMQISSPTDVWKNYDLQGRESGVIEAVAISPKAVDFAIKLQER